MALNPAGVCQQVGESPLKPSLSVILPVRNAQRRLVDRVATLLEIVPDLTPAFDITIIDDGSTDHTFEIAQGLARYYPQVQLLRHPMCHGHAVSVETGLRHTTGEIVFIQDDRAPISPSRIRHLWGMRVDQCLVPAGSETKVSEESTGIVQRMVNWAATLKSTSEPHFAHCQTEMIRRGTVGPLGPLTDPASHLAAHRLVRTDRQQSESVAGEGPNFLLREKDVASHP